MKTYLKQLAVRVVCGGILGLAIGHTVYLIHALGGDVLILNPKNVIIHYIATLLVGMWCSGTSIVFDIEEWSLLRQTITHSILLAPYLPFAFYMGWVPPTTGGRIIFVFGYIITYAIIWFSFKIYWTKKAKELNEELERLNRKTNA